jgi:hypothetical protein
MCAKILPVSFSDDGQWANGDTRQLSSAIRPLVLGKAGYLFWEQVALSQQKQQNEPTGQKWKYLVPQAHHHLHTTLHKVSGTPLLWVSKALVLTDGVLYHVKSQVQLKKWEY